jgi:hypothetical protein
MMTPAMESTERDEMSAKRDRAVLAIAPIVLGLNEKGKTALALEGSAYMNDVELDKLYSIVLAVERELKG